MYTTAEVGEILGLSSVNIRAHCEHYEHVGVKKGNTWILLDKDVEFIKSRMGKVGAPRQRFGESEPLQ